MTPYSVLIAAALTASPAGQIDFDTEVMPIFTKAGCNVGACHGSAKGRGGFRLSLYGSDAAADYDAIVRQHEGRRVNLSDAESSLLLMKPTEALEHGGGYRLDTGGAAVSRLTRWISEGARRIRRRALSDLEIKPDRFVGSQIGDRVQLRSFARFDDGTLEEVTQWTVFQPEDDAAVRVDEQTGMAHLVRPGRHVVVARYSDRVVPLELTIPMSSGRVDLSKAARHNFVDDEILETLKTLRLPVSAQADDGVFLRRAYLDLAGRLPRLEEINAFREDQRTHKRSRLIDRLLESDDYVDYWTYRMGKLLRIKPQGRGQGRDSTGANVYYAWLREQIALNTPFDQIARTLITAEGDSHEFGPANFYRTVSGARNQAEFMSELFMASRLRCANCHNHPLDRWTQDDYHGFAAVFARIDQKRVVKRVTRGQVIHPRTGEPARPRIPGDRFLDETLDGRRVFADWLTSPENSYFAKSTVNRLWKALMGRGLVEPSDDLRQTNLATHPRLLERLADDFVHHGYDLRHTLRFIARSAAYQRARTHVPGNEVDDRYYSRAISRPVEAEVLADSLSDVTGVWDAYGDNPAGTRAILLYDPAIESKSLDVLGRCSREESCETASESVAGGVSRKLHLVNGRLLNGKITADHGRLHQLISSGASAETIIDEFYRCALSRAPHAAERELWAREFEGELSDSELVERLEDFLWSLLSCREFVTK